MIRLRIFRRLSGWVRNETGGTIAELAILIPFLIVMVAAVTELGRFFQTYSTLAKSTRASARYLSKVAYDGPDGPYARVAKNIAFCAKRDCTGIDPVVSNLEMDDIVVFPPEYPPGGEGNPITVTVRIQNYTFAPLFDIGALLNSTFTLALPVRPSTTMYYMWTEPAGAEE